MIVRINLYRTPTGCRLTLEQGGKIGPTYHPFLARGRVGPFRFQESHGILGAIDGRTDIGCHGPEIVGSHGILGAVGGRTDVHEWPEIVLSFPSLFSESYPFSQGMIHGGPMFEVGVR